MKGFSRESVSRRGFLMSILPAAVVSTVLAGGHFRNPNRVWAANGAAGWEHPDPRPGIDGSTVLTAQDLVDTPHAVEVYEAVREIAHIADGIRCHCGCADLPRMRSLLSCFEKGGMARYCRMCQAEARLVWTKYREGKDLDQIRGAVDARFGR